MIPGLPRAPVPRSEFDLVEDLLQQGLRLLTNDEDEPVSGADFMSAYIEWRVRARNMLAYMNRRGERDG